VLVLRGENLSPYVEVSRTAEVIPSKLGEVDPAKLGFLTSDLQVKLLGGYACQCHQTTFQHIVKAVATRKLENVRVTIPYAGCFVPHLESTDAAGKKNEGPSGTANQILERPRAEFNDSYNLTEVGRYSYDLTKVDRFMGVVPLLRDSEGRPQGTTPHQRDGVLYRVYFERYLDSEGRKAVPHCVTYDGDSITFILNPDKEIRARYEQEVVDSRSVDRYPLMSPELLERAAAERQDRSQFLRSYIHRITERTREFSVGKIRDYINVYHGVDHAELTAITTQRDLNSGIKTANVNNVQRSLHEGAKVTSEIDLSPVYASKNGTAILALLLPHLSQYQIVGCWRRCAQEGCRELAELVRPRLSDIHAETSPADGDALTNALRHHQYEHAQYLLEIGMDPHRIRGLLGTVGVYMELNVLTETMKMIQFSERERADAFARVVNYHSYTKDEATHPKLLILGESVDEEHLEYARQRGFVESVEEILKRRAARAGG
jgi:hypothetical protein